MGYLLQNECHVLGSVLFFLVLQRILAPFILRGYLLHLSLYSMSFFFLLSCVA